jgi:hypothetical protein
MPAFICVHLLLLFSFLALAAGAATTQQVVDRIVATIEGEPVTQSELVELGRFQQLTGGPLQNERELLARCVEQWIVAQEAQAARLARPAAADVDREATRLAAQFPTPAAYAARLHELGLTPAAVRRLLERQLFLARYLDARFRPAVQVDAQHIETYYRGDLTRALAAQGRELPPLDAVREQIRELLTQREISERAGRWLDDSRSRIRVETFEKGSSR